MFASTLANRRRDRVASSALWIAPPEYLILRKLESLREGGQDKHPRDIRFMLAATGVDRAFLEAEIARLGLLAQWRQCAPDDQG